MMDRLEVDPLERSVRVVDYKFTASPKAPEEMLERYGLQLELYAFAALQLVPFKPERLEAVLAHFTQSEGLRWIELPSERLERSALEARVEAYFRLSRNESGQNPVPTQGSHCRYCEFRERCPRPGPRF
jgi:RecB family exonuclease